MTSRKRVSRMTREKRRNQHLLLQLLRLQAIDRRRDLLPEDRDTAVPCRQVVATPENVPTSHMVKRVQPHPVLEPRFSLSVRLDQEESPPLVPDREVPHHIAELGRLRTETAEACRRLHAETAHPERSRRHYQVVLDHQAIEVEKVAPPIPTSSGHPRGSSEERPQHLHNQVHSPVEIVDRLKTRPSVNLLQHHRAVQPTNHDRKRRNPLHPMSAPFQVKLPNKTSCRGSNPNQVQRYTCLYQSKRSSRNSWRRLRNSDRPIRICS